MLKAWRARRPSILEIRQSLSQDVITVAAGLRTSRQAAIKNESTRASLQRTWSRDPSLSQNQLPL
jgi:hypothetical protein